MMIKRTFAAALMALAMGVSVFSTTAFAYTGETEATEEKTITIQRESEQTQTEAQKDKEIQKDGETKDTAVKESEQESFQLDDETMKEIQKMLLAYLAGNDKITISVGDGETVKTGTVTVSEGSRLNVRTGGGLDYQVIDQLRPGEKVTVIGEDGGWYEVTIPEKTGYVSGEFLKVEETTTGGASMELDADMLTSLWHLIGGCFSEGSTPALTPDGNLTLIDDVGSSTKAGKQFITLVTKSGNYFYMVIDRDDKGEENVHFMNLVDEADLFALMDEEQVAEYQAAMDAQKEDETVEVTEPEPKDPQEIEGEKPEKKVNWAPLMLLAIVGVGGAGVFGYTALNKKKQEKVAARPEPDADYEDEDEDEEEYIIPDDDTSDEAEMSEDFEDDEN